MPLINKLLYASAEVLIISSHAAGLGRSRQRALALTARHLQRLQWDPALHLCGHGSTGCSWLGASIVLTGDEDGGIHGPRQAPPDFATILPPPISPAFPMCSKGAYKQEWDNLYMQSDSNRTRGNDLKLEEEKFRLDFRKKHMLLGGC